MIQSIGAVYAAVVGACIGSFLNVCVHRWPREQSVVRPRSACPGCGHSIAWYENIPILSWIVLRARCRGCGTGISAMYPMVELTVAVLWILPVLHYGVTFTALRVAIFATLLLGITMTDAREYIIPDGFTVTGLLWGLAAALIALVLGDPYPFAEPWPALLGACVGAGAIAIVGWLGEAALKKEAMGFGDVTLMAMAGVHLGPERALLTIFLGAALGAVLFLLVVVPIGWYRSQRRGEEFVLPLVPFGVFLAPAALIALFVGEPLIDWYVRGILGA